MSPPPREVVIDATVLINLCHAERLDLLGALSEFAFVVPPEVIAEVIDPTQRQRLQSALECGDLREEALTDPAELAAYAALRRMMGTGEAACLALAEHRGWLLAGDEKRRFRREALSRLGEGRLVTTAGLLLLGIRAGLLSVEEADAVKEVLEQHRFRMVFGSFRELLEEG
jgi:predicted nucleic acid-binding protein